jgi:preprotein translocase subunit SecA
MFTRFSGKLPVRRLWNQIADKVIEGAEAVQFFDDHRLRKESLALRYSVLCGEPEEKVLVRAFTLVREASRRVLGMQHYPVQIVGGIALHQGGVAVMQTGEGKTLTATLPLYLAALCGRGVHLATANDYLAARDAGQMQPLFAALGLTTGCVCQPDTPCERRKAYRADITYSTGKEIGFDFLRDRLRRRSYLEAGLPGAGDSVADTDGADDRYVQRELHFMLVDEADSLLIDEARTPLVISALPPDSAEKDALCRWSAENVGRFEAERHYRYDESHFTCRLTPTGRTFARKLSRPEILATTSSVDFYDQIETALLVNRRFVRDRQYLVRDGEVIIVDEFTGRLAEGRKWRAGLHQAIEAREGLEITPGTSEAARITVQDLFRRYQRLCGMTGTVASSARELYTIYGTPSVAIPTNRPPRREQLPGLVFGNAAAKWNAIASEAIAMSESGRPVLVGTRSIDKSELLSRILGARDCPHQVLNARHLASEAELVAEAGRTSRITVATNMAGRGTDIQLSEEARRAGGMHVIISELHESARIDRQLIGRCGRQGDPGSFRFFMALDDEILSAGLGPKVARHWMLRGEQGDHFSSDLARLFFRAQAKVETAHFRARKALMHQERARQLAQQQLGQDPYIDTIA